MVNLIVALMCMNITSNICVGIEHISTDEQERLARELKIVKNVYDPTRTNNEPIQIPDNGNADALPGVEPEIPKEFECSLKELKFRSGWK